MASETTVGSTRKRARSEHTEVRENDSFETQLHTTLYHRGQGGWKKGEGACDAQHHAKARLLSVNPCFRHADEVVYAKFLAGIKRNFHAGGGRVGSGNVVQAGPAKIAAEIRANKRANRAAHDAARDPLDSFTGRVGKKVVGSKAYWHDAFLGLMATAVTHGLPQYFATFTANEFGWTDMTAACDGHQFNERPVESTRHYHHRWKLFKEKYLAPGTDSPIGLIERTWHRHEDQKRGSLHVHMAIWVARDTERTENIRGTAPRETVHPDGSVTPLTAAEALWRDFVLNVQTHECTRQCFFKKGVELNACKSGYPRPLRDEIVYNDDTGRFEYVATEPEDTKLSPYVTEWLLAWGANINVQYCTTAHFLSYIAKYVTKPEPNGLASDIPELRERDNLSPQQRFLHTRVVRAAEVVSRVRGVGAFHSTVPRAPTVGDVTRTAAGACSDTACIRRRAP